MTKVEILREQYEKMFGTQKYDGSVNRKMNYDYISPAMDVYAKQESIAFANWIDGQQLECDLMTDDGEKHWVYMFPERHGKKRYTTEELYTLYLNQH